MKSIRAEARRLLELAADDGELRADLRALAEEILAATEVSSPSVSSPVIEPAMGFQHPLSGPAPSIDEELACEPQPNPLPPHDDATEPLRELTLGQSRPTSPGDSIAPSMPAKRGVAGADLASLEARCRRKAEAARWAAECQRRIREGADFHGADDPLDEEMAEWARKLTDGLYWMSSQTASDSAEVAILDDIAGCFDTIAESLALVQETQGRGKISSKLFNTSPRRNPQHGGRCKKWTSLTIGTKRTFTSGYDPRRRGNGSISVVTCELTTWPTRPDGPRC